MAKRHFLLQAHKHGVKHAVAGQFMSEKLDGHRCFWDGGITAGIPCPDIPWANTAKHKKVRIATGLWSRYGNPIHAPQWFTGMLPKFPLDGELWGGSQKFQSVSSYVKKHVPVNWEWEKVIFMTFDSPCLADVLYDSEIDQKPNFIKDISGSFDYITGVLHTQLKHHSALFYRDVLDWMITNVHQNEYCKILPQIPLSDDPYEANVRVERFLATVLERGGEGIVLRSPLGLYIPERAHHITKMKPYKDSEGTVTGYVTGRETDRGSKLLGMMGAMIVEWRGKTFELSGFTERERQLVMPSSFGDEQDFNEAYSWACRHPETICPASIEAAHFPRGTSVTFKYRELTDAGIPKEASYFRKHVVL